MDKEGLTWDKVSKEKLLLLYLWMLPCIIGAWSYAVCSRHLFLFFFSLSTSNQCTWNLVSSLLVKTWHVV